MANRVHGRSAYLIHGVEIVRRWNFRSRLACLIYDSSSHPKLAGVFIIKLNADGTQAWTQGFGDSDNDQHANAILITEDGNIAIGGDYTGTLNFNVDPGFSSTFPTGFVALFANDGQGIAWQKSFKTTSGAQHVTGIATDETRMYVGGDINGEAYWEENSALALTTANRLFLASFALSNGQLPQLRGFKGSGAPRINAIATNDKSKAQ